MTYIRDFSHCTAHDENGFCPLLNCYRYWLHSERIRLQNESATTVDEYAYAPYVLPQYSHGECPNYLPTKK